VIAIDGPVAAGKTVVGRALAFKLGFKCLDTGIMYRAITWLALQHSASLDDEAALGKLAEDYPVRLQGQSGDAVVVGDYQVGPELRESGVNSQVSLVSRVSAVRRALVRQQRELALEGHIVMVGRDIGTVVLPDADLKVYLSASAESRAARRWHEMINQGQSAEFQQVLAETRARDEIDSLRADSPLTPAADAFLSDTENLTVEQVIQRILERIRELAAEGER
jgi:cytidylate kinase